MQQEAPGSSKNNRKQSLAPKKKDKGQQEMVNDPRTNTTATTKTAQHRPTPRESLT
jgi:hypothetical protein